MDPTALTPALLRLLDELTDTMFCAKDAAGRYTAVNPTFVNRAGATSRRQVLGHRAEDLFVPALAERYLAQDAKVLAGAELHRELELIRPLATGERRPGAPRWYLTSKLPVHDGDGAVIGLVSLSQDVGEQRADGPVLARVFEEIAARVADPPSAGELAALAGLPAATLTGRLRRITGLSTTQLVLRARVDHAAHLLARSDDPLAKIATATGFYDQAAFSRQFARLSGETPAQFRRRERRAL